MGLSRIIDVARTGLFDGLNAQIILARGLSSSLEDGGESTTNKRIRSWHCPLGLVGLSDEDGVIISVVLIKATLDNTGVRSRGPPRFALLSYGPTREDPR